MTRRFVFSAAIAIGLALVGCASETSEPSSATAEDALSSANTVFVGSYRSADAALYPTFALAADGTYSWDTGIRCITAPCPSGDTGRWTVYTSGSTKFIDLQSNARGIADRWFKAGLSPVTLRGVFGTTGTFAKVVDKVCGADDWQTIIAPTVGQVEGIWSRHNQVGIVVTDETLRLHADSNYQLTKTIGPGCDAQGHCAKFLTREEQSEGTFVLNPGQGVQLVPSAPAPDDVALSWILQLPCGQTTGYRLASTETNVDVFLASAGQCLADSDCEAGDAGPNTLLCMRGMEHAVTCNVSTKKCQNTCKPIVPVCNADEQLCPKCGAAPIDGVCQVFGCYPKTQACPLFP